MKTIPEWPEAQRLEKNLWDGVVLDEHYTLTVLTANAAKAIKLPQLRNAHAETGAGSRDRSFWSRPHCVSARKFPAAYGIDPLPLRVPGPSRRFAQKIQREASPVYGPVARPGRLHSQRFGEDMPVASDSMDLVLCCNALDHASDPLAVLREIHRVLKPGGLFFFEVDTLSVLGLAKWHTYTKYKHKDEILVKAHPYRMYESDVAAQT